MELHNRLYHWLDQAIDAAIDNHAMPYEEALRPKTVDEGKSYT